MKLFPIQTHVEPLWNTIIHSCAQKEQQQLSYLYNRALACYFNDFPFSEPLARQTNCLFETPYSGKDRLKISITLCATIHQNVIETAREYGTTKSSIVYTAVKRHIISPYIREFGQEEVTKLLQNLSE